MSDLHGSARLMWRADFQAEAYVYATAARNNPNYEKVRCFIAPVLLSATRPGSASY